mmetsp:Transcript_83242/g.226055  ORF Transcript_83242/g.226055 Transcript_83242/m.226055 type:complete len:217 (+) Transcript_83242:548-1198(+)
MPGGVLGEAAEQRSRRPGSLGGSWSSDGGRSDSSASAGRWSSAQSPSESPAGLGAVASRQSRCRRRRPRCRKLLQPRASTRSRGGALGGGEAGSRFHSRCRRNPSRVCQWWRGRRSAREVSFSTTWRKNRKRLNRRHRCTKQPREAGCRKSQSSLNLQLRGTRKEREASSRSGGRKRPNHRQHRRRRRRLRSSTRWRRPASPASARRRGRPQNAMA